MLCNFANFPVVLQLPAADVDQSEDSSREVSVSQLSCDIDELRLGDSDCDAAEQEDRPFCLATDG